MNQKEIQDLIKLLGKTDITEFKLKDKEFSISIRTAKHNDSNGTPTVIPVMQQAPVAAAPVAAPAAAPSAPAAPAAKTEDAPAEESDKYEVFKSPMVGTFYRKPAPDKDVFVQVGDTVKTGDVICVVEAMKLFNEIESEMSGTIVKVLVDDASPVEYDQPLFLIDPA